MRFNLLLFVGLTGPASLLLLSPANAQSIGNGRLLIDSPNNPLTCEPTTVQWIWTGTSYDAQTHTVSVAVEQTGDSNNRRSLLAEPSPIRFIRKRAAVGKTLHARDGAINIAGGTSIPLSVGSWTWNSVGVPIGTYRMALTIDGEGITAFSSSFLVSQGPDTSCLGSLADASTTVAGSSSSSAVQTSAPTDTSAVSSDTTAAVVPTASASNTSSNPTSTSTLPDTNHSAAQSQESKASGGGLSGGSIAAAVIVPLIAVAVLLWLACIRRRKQKDADTPAWSEKFRGLFAGDGNMGHRRQISGPMDPVHAAGLAMHEHAVKNRIRPAGEKAGEMTAAGSGAAVTRTPEHWVDFNPEVKEADARLVSPGQVDEMVRVSMEASEANNAGKDKFYQQGDNGTLRESGVTDTSSLPSYLRDVDFTSHHTHSSFGHDANGTPVQAESSAGHEGVGLERSESKVRRKPVPTYRSSTTAGEEQESRLGSPDSSTTEVFDSDGRSPFSDVHAEIGGSSESGQDRHVSTATSSTVIHDHKLKEMLGQADEEVLLDSPTPRDARTPINDSGAFPVSVHSSLASSPAQRVLLDMPRESLSEEQKKDLYKLSVQLPKEDRGFRVSF